MKDLCVPLSLIAGAFLILGVDILFKRAKARLLEVLSYVTVILAFVAVAMRSPSAVPEFSGAIINDGLSVFMSIAILVATGLALLQSTNLAQRSSVMYAEFLALVLLAASGMCFLVMSNDLITLFLSLEIMSLAVYVLTGATRNEPRSTEASIKYFIMGSVASAFLVYGMVLIFGVTNSIQLPEIGVKLAGQSSPVALLGVGMLMIGFAFKVGAVPFHMWVPDVYEGAPTAVTSFMSVAVKAAAFGTLIRTVGMMKTPLPGKTGEMLQWIAILTMIVGNVMAIAQPSVKRMLAYSSIAHSGYALIGVVVAATVHEKAGRFDGASATGFYLLAYTFMTLGAFAILSFAGSKSKDAERLDDLQGLGTTRPFAAFLMSVFMLSLAGIPPLAGFMGKFLLFRAALDSGLTALVIVAVITTLVSVYYYVRVIVVMYMKPAPGQVPVERGDFGVGLAVSVAGLFTLFLGLLPGKFMSLAGSLLQRLSIPG